ncbi:LPXTG cell wall anchor domain-containing protein [Phytoactinopolyspora alkaliphila]|uniref:LPXTG cell wall anchor domain-containing protein n=1 Tax=Phytoactinopolyspora alkaliphila TaxID=1783498 RepID=A0A6N9YLW0_9ACTN|nr:LPXTG cell wall anchor domain-containing protein [Phytoactinopolyspora alkaliphila]NED96016.1 LPXTG cell wall anchor domain-containing protein [Phytoactinopolyspora alkaliphila]
MRSIRHTRRFAAVVALGIGLGAVGSTAASAATQAGGPLPDTGSSVQWWLIAAIAVLLVGGGLYAYSRWSGKRGSSE